VTLSKTVRLAELTNLLLLALQQLGDSALYAVAFSAADKQFATVPSATWQEAVELGLLLEDDSLGTTTYLLSGRGWIEALDASGALGQPALAQDLGRLSAALKATVKGRSSSVTLTTVEASKASGLAAAWIYNVIDSNLLETRFGRRGARWHDKFAGRLIVVPVTFGMEAVDLDANLRARIDDLEGHLEDHRERLREFTCPTCGAPVVGQTVIDYEHHDALYRNFACGYEDEDGRLRRPCPSSGQFPAAAEFEAMLTERDGEPPRWRWHCWLQPTSESARRLSLMQGYGHTAAEAEDDARATYQRYAKRWTRPD
jgi:hypothetical protein